MRPRSPLDAALLALVGVATVAGCAVGGEGDGVARSTAGPASAGPQLPADYAYTLRSSCGERSLIGTYAVTVRAGRVVSAVDVTARHRTVPPEDVPSLADLLAMAGTAGPEALVDLRADEAGLPLSLSIDHEPDAIDDEECYEVTDLATPAG